MRVAALIARYLLGLIFAVFGANGFLHFIKEPPPTNPLAIQFFTAATASHFAYMFFGFQLLAGLLLLSGFFVPLALVILAAELANILAYHATMDPSGFGPGVLACVLWLVTFWGYRASFAPLLAARAQARG